MSVLFRCVDAHRAFGIISWRFCSVMEHGELYRGGKETSVFNESCPSDAFLKVFWGDYTWSTRRFIIMLKFWNTRRQKPGERTVSLPGFVHQRVRGGRPPGVRRLEDWEQEALTHFKPELLEALELGPDDDVRAAGAILAAKDV